MNPSTSTRLAWSLFGVYVLTAAATLWLAVARDTLHPAYVSLWLRGDR